MDSCERVPLCKSAKSSNSDKRIFVVQCISEGGEIVRILPISSGDNRKPALSGRYGRYGGGIVSHEISMPPSKPPRRRHWIVRGALVAIFLVVACGFGASQVSTGDYSVTPGGAEPVAPLITIDGKQGTNNSGHILLTDVYLTPLSWLTYLPAWFNSDAEIVSGDALVTPGVSVNDRGFDSLQAWFDQNDPFYNSAWAMRSGGSFAGHIADAYMVADSHNRVILVTAFRDLFKRFMPTSVTDEA